MRRGAGPRGPRWSARLRAWPTSWNRSRDRSGFGAGTCQDPLTSDLNHSSIRGMGRTPGATAAGTQQRLLRAAADVFARRGYEGARVADIAATAELSNGALYSYFGSKADLLVQALRAHGSRLLGDL